MSNTSPAASPGRLPEMFPGRPCVIRTRCVPASYLISSGSALSHARCPADSAVRVQARASTAIFRQWRLTNSSPGSFLPLATALSQLPWTHSTE